MQPHRFFLPPFLCCAALSPALAGLTEASADDMYVLRHWKENRGSASSMNAGESTKLLVSPDGQHKAEYFQDGCGAAIHNFRLYHERDGKWYTTPTTSGADYYTHKFFTRYAWRTRTTASPSPKPCRWRRKHAAAGTPAVNSDAAIVMGYPPRGHVSIVAE